MTQKKDRPFHRNQLVDLEIQDLAFGGRGLAKVATPQGHYVVFIPGTLPGQQVRCRITKPKNSYAEAKLQQILSSSPQEEASPYQATPGAPFLNWPLARQKDHKYQSTLDLYQRIGKVEEVKSRFDHWIDSPRSTHFRNKMEYSFSAVRYDAAKDSFEDDFALGFKKRGQWLAVEPLERDSGLFDSDWENLLPDLSQYFQDQGHTAWHPRTHQGFLRMLAVRKSFTEDALLVNLVSSSQELSFFDAAAWAHWLQEQLGSRLAGVLHTINDDPSDRPRSTDGQRHQLLGRNSLQEELLGLRFQISLESFFQTNPASAELLYRQALDYVWETPPPEDAVVLDLFSGTGTITQLLAQGQPSATIIGVEIVPEAVEDAKANAQANGFSDLQFVAADVGRFLLEHPQYQGRIHTVVLDPPRAGIAPKTLRKVMRLGAQRIVYISCNPATQARDFETLQDWGYQLDKFSLVDQFPQTAHVESIALLSGRP